MCCSTANLLTGAKEPSYNLVRNAEERTGGSAQGSIDMLIDIGQEKGKHRRLCNNVARSFRQVQGKCRSSAGQVQYMAGRVMHTQDRTGMGVKYRSSTYLFDPYVALESALGK